MSVKVLVLVEGATVPVQVGGTWWGVSDAASDIGGGDFYSDLGKLFPQGVRIAEIRIVPDEPLELEAEEG